MRKGSGEGIKHRGEGEGAREKKLVSVYLP
jgi:hypothetical protein